MLNSIVLNGRLVKEAEFMQTSTGTTMTTFTLAVQIGKDAEGKSIAMFVDCVAYGNLASNIIKFVSKGQKMSIAGKLSQRVYKTKDETGRKVFYVLVDEADFDVKTEQKEGD